MFLRSLPLTIVAILIAATASTAGAEAPDRTEFGPAQGVQARASGTAVDIRFTGASAAFGQAYAGEQVTVVCALHPAGDLLLLSDDGDAQLGQRSTEARVAADGSALHAALRGAPGDACEIFGERYLKLPGTELARAALTPAGANWIDEQVLATRMMDLAHAAAPGAAYRSAEDVVKLGSGEIVALDGPAATPPPGKIGYWSHGRAASFAAVSAAGRRLAVQDLGGGMLRTDIFEAVASWTPPEGYDASGTMAAAITGGATEENQDDVDFDALNAARGVTGRVANGQVVVRFGGREGAKAYRRLVGRRTRVVCGAVPAPVLLGAFPDWGTPSVHAVTVPRHGGVLRVPASGASDLCVIRDRRRAVSAVAVAATDAGRRYLRTIQLLTAFFVGAPSLELHGATSYPGAATIAASQDGVIPMSSPGQALPPLRFGVWTDGGRRASITLTSTDGHRLVAADEGDGWLRTNYYALMLAASGYLV